MLIVNDSDAGNILQSGLFKYGHWSMSIPSIDNVVEEKIKISNTQNPLAGLKIESNDHR